MSGAGHLQDGPTARRPAYRLIQVLRAVAALMVVAHHTTIMLEERFHLPPGNWIAGSAGVDIFFVISGFVMTISSEPLRGTPHPARTFLARRLERIVPMYWIVTAAKVAVLLCLPALAYNALGSIWHVVASFLFVPSPNPSGSWEPVVVVGWTLSFEMLFYVLFAAVLAMRAPLLRTLAPLLIVLSMLWMAPQPGVPYALMWFESPMLLEFLGGVMLAKWLPQVKRLPWPLAILLVTTGFALLVKTALPDAFVWRGIAWGVPALAVVCGSLALEDRSGGRVPRGVLMLGDASYSIYLVHGFVIPGVGLLLEKVGTGWTGVVPVVLTGAVVLSAAVGVVVYQAVERPIAKWLKGRRKTAAPVAE